MKPIRYRSEYGVYHGLMVKQGTKKLHLLLVRHPVKVIKVDKSELRNIQDFDYKVSKIITRLKNMARTEYGDLRKIPNTLKAVFKG